jgi:hypothetical protein
VLPTLTNLSLTSITVVSFFVTCALKEGAVFVIVVLCVVVLCVVVLCVVVLCVVVLCVVVLCVVVLCDCYKVYAPSRKELHLLLLSYVLLSKVTVVRLARPVSPRTCLSPRPALPVNHTNQRGSKIERRIRGSQESEAVENQRQSRIKGSRESDDRSVTKTAVGDFRVRVGARAQIECKRFCIRQRTIQNILYFDKLIKIFVFGRLKCKIFCIPSKIFCISTLLIKIPWISSCSTPRR